MFPGSPASPRALAALYRSLATLERAGVPPLQAAAALEAPGGSAGAVVSAVQEALSAGRPLSTGLAPLARRLLPPWHVAVAAAGEAAGRLPETLDGLGAACEDAARARHALAKALQGPVSILTVAALTFPLPVFARSGLAAWAPLTALLLVPPVTLALLPELSARAATGQPLARRILSALPFARRFAVRDARARALAALGSLAGAGVEVGAALMAAGAAAGDERIELAARAAARGITKGQPLGEALVSSGLVERRHASFGAEAEATGRIDLAALRLARLLEEESCHSARVRLRWLAIAFDLGVALFVAVLVLTR